MKRMLALLLFASPALAAPKIENLSVKASSKSPEVEIAITVSRSSGSCDVRVDFGDGRGRTVDFGLATNRTLKYAYRKGGNFKISAKGVGKTPCEGAKEVALNIAGAAAEKKAEKKKAEKKKADKKSAPKKEQPK